MPPQQQDWTVLNPQQPQSSGPGPDWTVLNPSDQQDQNMYNDPLLDYQAPGMTSRFLNWWGDLPINQSFTGDYFGDLAKKDPIGNWLYNYGETHGDTLLGKLALTGGAFNEAYAKGIDKFLTPFNVATMGVGELAQALNTGKAAFNVGKVPVFGWGSDASIASIPFPQVQTGARAVNAIGRGAFGAQAATGLGRIVNPDTPNTYEGWMQRAQGLPELAMGVLGMRNNLMKIGEGGISSTGEVPKGPVVPYGFEDLGIIPGKPLPESIIPKGGPGESQMLRQLGYIGSGEVTPAGPKMILPKPELSADIYLKNSEPTIFPKGTNQSAIDGALSGGKHHLGGVLPDGSIVIVPNGTVWKPTIPVGSSNTTAPTTSPNADFELVNATPRKVARAVADGYTPTYRTPDGGVIMKFGGVSDVDKATSSLILESTTRGELPVDPNLNNGVGDPALAGTGIDARNLDWIPEYPTGGIPPEEMPSSVPKPTGDRAPRGTTQPTTELTEEENPFGLEVQPTVAPSPTVGPTSSLPKTLESYKGTFKIGPDSFTPVFANDIDKAAYMISSPTRPPNTEILKYVMEKTGLTQANAIAYGRRVRNAVRDIAGKSNIAGEVNILPMGPDNKGMKGILSKFMKESSGEYDPLTGWRNLKSVFTTKLETPPRGQQAILRDEGGNPILNKEGQPINIRDIGKEIMHFSRQVLPGGDLSAPLRQGLPMLFNKAWWNAWKPMFEARRSEEGYNAVMSKLKDMELFQERINPATGKRTPSFAEQIGVKLTDVNSITDMEESIASKWAQVIPGIRASDRAYTAYLNVLRAQSLTNLMEDATRMGLNPRQNMVLAKEIGDYIMTATGRGPLKTYFPGITYAEGQGVKVGAREASLEQHAKLMSNLLFAPRLQAARLRMMNPFTYTMASPFVRQQYFKSALSTMAAWGGFAGLGYIGGADVSMDPNSSDFLKIKIGNTRLDPGAGFQQYAVALSRFISGQYTSSSSGQAMELGQTYRGPTRFDVATQFASNKLHPFWKLGYDLVTASQARPIYGADRIVQMMVPLMYQDAWEILNKDPTMAPILGGVLFGMGTQTYEPRGAAVEEPPLLIPHEYDYKFTGGGPF